jgi:Cu+-exporting ATPase
MNAKLLPLLLAGLVAGCTAPSLPPDSSDHPANPHAAVAPLPPPSPTLALNEGPASPATAPAVYTCPHHPEVVSNQPGDCPKCGMALTPEPATQPSTEPAKAQDHSGHQGHSAHEGHEGHGGHQ